MKKILTFAFILLIYSSCDKNLDIEPQQAISTDIALSDEQGIRTALIGTYDLLSQLPRSSGDIILNTKLFADTEDVFWTGFFIPLTQVLDKNIATDNTAIENYWVYSYRTINQANTVLHAIKGIEDIDLDAISAELRFIRALVYFDLINMFAQPWTSNDPMTQLGVPIVVTPAEISLANPEVPRSSVFEVYEFIVEDLLFAKSNLPEQNGVFANTFTASALLSRVYLMQEEFELATNESDRIINSGNYTLQNNLEDIFNQSTNSSEDIFSIQSTQQDYENRVSHFYSGELEGGGGFIGITDEHLDKYESGDLRATLFYQDRQSGTRRSSKWKVNDSNDGNVTTIRLAEIYLTRAEGRYHTGDMEGSLRDLNIIRNRAGLSALNELNLDTILEERYLELIFEGHQFRDTKRCRKMFGDVPFDDPRMIYPIPQREMDINRTLIQNEGY